MVCNFFGEGARFHHVGLAVKSIQDINSAAEIFDDEVQRSLVAFINLNGITIELVQPNGEGSPVARSVQAGIKLLHVCYEVPDLDAVLASCRAFGFHRIGPPEPAVAFEGRRIAWVLSRAYGLFELLERNKGANSSTRHT